MSESVTPHIVVRGIERAVAWYIEALGAEEVSRIPLPGDRVMTVELRFGTSSVHLADEFPEMGIVSPETIGGTAVVLNLETDDVDALWQRAVGAGAEVRHELADQFWGDRQGQIADPFGHRWNLAQHVRDVPHDEVVRAAAAIFGGGCVAWYIEALGAEEVSRIPLPGDRVMTVELRFGNSSVHLADEFPEMGIVSPETIGGTAVVLNLETGDVDVLWQRAVAAGAVVRHELADQFWGDRQGQIEDPFGHRWNLAQHVRDVPRDEIVRAAAAIFGGG